MVVIDIVLVLSICEGSQSQVYSNGGGMMGLKEVPNKKGLESASAHLSLSLVPSKVP